MKAPNTAQRRRHTRRPIVLEVEKIISLTEDHEAVLARIPKQWYKTLLQSPISDSPRKCNWTKHEDKLLSELVRKHGMCSWGAIARFLPGRVGKQARERWINHLDPMIRCTNQYPFTELEDEEITRMQKEHGNKWTLIARNLDGRTPNQIKARWNNYLRRKELERIIRK